MAVSDWSTTAGDNGTVGAVNIAELCPAANVNNAIREVMAQIAQWRDGLDGDYQSRSTTLDAFSGLAVNPNTFPYSPTLGVLDMAPLTAFARSLLDDPDAANACLTLGAIRVAALSLTSPGYVRLQLGASSVFQIAWGAFIANANGTTSVNYAAAFPNASFALCNGGTSATDANSNWPTVQGESTSGFTAFSASNTTVACRYIAVGY